MAQQPGRSVAWLDAEYVDSLGAVSPLDLVDRPEIGRLALAVGCPGIVLAIKIEVVEVDFRGPVGNGGN